MDFSVTKLEDIDTPWGKYRVLYSDHQCKLKNIIVNVGHRLSLQYHTKRDEVWKLIEGKALIKVESNTFTVDASKERIPIHIPKRFVHRITNIGETPLIFLELQTGESFQEEDIIRIADDYNRINFNNNHDE